MLPLGLFLAVVNVVWITMLAISVLRLLDNPLYVRSVSAIIGMAAVAIVLRLLRLRTLADWVSVPQIVVTLALAIDGLDGVAY